MESIITIILSVITAIGGFEAVKYFLNRKSEKRKSEAEANSAMAGVLKEMTESYQLFVENTKSRIEDDSKYIGALKEDRRQLLDEREELRQRIDDTDKKVMELQREVARNGRMVESMRPLLCGRICAKRLDVAISDDGDIDDKNIEPIKNDTL